MGIFAKMFRTFVYILEENNQQTQIAKQKFKKFWHVLKLDFWILMEVWNSLLSPQNLSWMNECEFETSLKVTKHTKKESSWRESKTFQSWKKSLWSP